MINLLFPIIIIGILLFFNLKIKRRWLLPSSIVISLFFLSVILAYPYILIYHETAILKENYLEGSIVFCFLIVVYIVPFLSFRDDQVKTILLPNKKFLFIFSVIICLLSLFSVMYFISTSIKALTTSDIGDARIDMVQNGKTLVSKTILNTIAGTAASFYQIPIFLFFIYEILNQHKVLKWLLFTSSFSYILFVLSFFGRDGILFWFLSFLGIMGFFYPFIKNNFKKKVKFYLMFFVIIGGSFFMIISFSRFGEETFSSILGYIGQGFPNFCLFYKVHIPIDYGNSTFPLFRSLFGLTDKFDFEFQSYLLELGGTKSTVFGTFLKSFMSNFGFIGTTILGFVFFVLFKFTVRKRKFSVAHLFIYLLYFQIFYQGVFYFRQYNRVGNLLIIVSFVLYLIFYLKIKYGINNVLISNLNNINKNKRVKKMELD